MSKSTGNYIGIAEPPEVQYGKVMSLPDDAMRGFFELVTRWTPAEIEALFADLEAGRVHPRDAKMRLAFEIVDTFHGGEAARAAEEHFRTVFQRRELPPDMPTWPLAAPVNLVDLLTEADLAPSKSEARRLVQQGAVRLDGEVVEDITTMIEPREVILQVGRRRFLQILPA
jgi:tyrosyl-tRNA synthetase